MLKSVQYDYPHSSIDKKRMSKIINKIVLGFHAHTGNGMVWYGIVGFNVPIDTL